MNIGFYPMIEGKSRNFLESTLSKSGLNGNIIAAEADISLLYGQICALPLAITTLGNPFASTTKDPSPTRRFS